MQKRVPFLFIYLFLLGLAAAAQTLTGSGGNIPDNGATHTIFNLNINGLNPTVLGNDFGLKSVCVTISHNNVSDLEVSLMSPSGTIVNLFSTVGGTGNNFNGTCLSMTASNTIASGTAPFNNTYIPQGDLNNFNNMQASNGIWKLRIKDNSPGFSGTLNSWSITFGALPFTSSDLPILLINTNNVTIPDEPKIPANLKIIYNGEGQRNYLTDTAYHFNDLIGIERRGSSSQGMPKKPYGFETWDAQHQDKNVSFLGLPPESDWTLIANYSDKTLMRNALSYHLSNKMGHYAPRTRFCEVLLNGSYQGVYLLTEKIKRDSARVDVAKLRHIDLSGNELTGGYIIKVDKLTGSGGDGWLSAVPPINASGNQTIRFQYVYPKPDSIQPQQKVYIKNFVDSFETALNSAYFQDETIGWRRFMDENSVIDFFLMNEMSRNVDGYRISTFLHKEKITKGNKLKMGPVWDYDIAWLNADYCSGQSTTGWAYNFNNVCGSDGSLVPFWWQRFRQDTLFNKRLYCRYTELRTSFLSLDSLNATVDGMANTLNESQARNFVKWPILGTYVWPNPSPIPANYAGEISKLKQWFVNRLGWMDSQINIYQTPAPQVNLGNDTAICFGNSVHLVAGNFPTILWNTGQTDPEIYAGIGDTYFVSIENMYGCHTSDTIQVAVNPLPTETFTYTQLGNFNFTFSPDGAGLNYEWDFGDGNTSTAPMPQHTYIAAGTYTVLLTVTDDNGCTAMGTQQVQTQTVSIKEGEGVAVSVFPNPFIEQLNIVGDWDKGVQITLVSIDGKTMLDAYRLEKNISLSTAHWAAGVYYLQIKTTDGTTAVHKVIKQ